MYSPDLVNWIYAQLAALALGCYGVAQILRLAAQKPWRNFSATLAVLVAYQRRYEHPVNDPATLESGGSAGKQGGMESLREDPNVVLAERRDGSLPSRLLPPDLLKFLRFAVVGGSGVLINMLVLWLLHDKVGLGLTRSSIAAISLAIGNNFLWNNFWTFKAKSIQTRRFVQFVVISVIGMVINLTILNILFAFGIHYAPANLAGIMVATAWNFYANSKWTWGEQ